MILKYRNESNELKIMRSLHVRMNLFEQDEMYYHSLEKGYAGEVVFDEIVQPLEEGRIFINDLILEHNNTMFQTDSLIITTPKIHLFEVKNFEGDFYIEKDIWYSMSSEKQIKNPIHQLHRNEVLLRGILTSLGNKTPIECHLIFVNPEFQLYQAPRNLPIIFPSQIKKFMNKLEREQSHITNKHTALAKKLLSHHIVNPPPFRLPDYKYEQLEKGIFCLRCHTMYDYFKGTHLHCKVCGIVEPYQTAVIRTVDEYRLLFPLEKVTTNRIQEWCKVVKSKKAMRNILVNNYTLVGHGKSSYYQ
ncbi:nuclease-related domain-containing protein [Pseudalkalibacillus berkeleyi]|uniref:NERD domain-containing protein n=1 Tax=Pseudalkalibacillus berkeleyi TaxID=1069813 RepID=A0ABS9H3C0_9BACL|nr:nuclease-related domain-containing protein [Pseudalkalibacillus berkeleyi]MCF6138337.1 NERD domain-containing protein [Pseudalkalibacillus berkeleyi]